MIRTYYDKTGKPLVKHTFTSCDEEDCTICKNIKSYFEIPAIFRQKRIDGLAIGNLKRHLKSGKHWKEVSYRFMD